MQPVAGSAVLAAKSASVARSSPCVLSIPVCRIVTFHPGELSGFLFSLPALKALREGFPGARICAVVRPSLAPFLRDSPLCDEVWPREKGGLSRQTSLMLQLRNFRPDIAVSFSRSRLSTLLAWSSGAEERVGFEGARMDTLLTQRVVCESDATPESYAGLVQTLGCTPKQTHARDLLTIGVEAEKSAQRVLEEHHIEGDFLVALCDGASGFADQSATSDEADFIHRESHSASHQQDIEYSHRASRNLSTGHNAANNAAYNAKESLSSVVEQGSLIAERVFQAGTQAMRSQAVRSQAARSQVARAAGSMYAASSMHADKTKGAAALAASALSVGALNSRRVLSQWPVAHWTQTLRELSGRAPVVLVGATQATSVTCHLESQVLDVGGDLEPVVIAAILRRARLFIGTDSGVLHLAAAVGTPVVGIYGPTDWRLSGPRGVPHRIVRHDLECSPCELSRCLWTGDDERKCLTRLSSQQVVEAARELIGL